MSVANQIMWNRLIAVVEEQALTLVRTAFSPSVREAGDVSAGVFDVEGRMIAQAVTGTPGHVNAMAAAVKNFIDAIGESNIRDGDVYFTNDPWLGTGHLLDFSFCTPSFRNGKLVGYFACTAHVVDVGGRGFNPDSNDVYEEGIYIPITHFAHEGVVDEKLLHIISYNIREPNMVIGDLHGLAACNEIGHRRLMEMMDEFGIDSLADLAAFVFDASHRATIDALKDLPKGKYASSMTVDGYNEPVTIAVELEVKPDGVHADLSGTSPVSPRGINVPMIYTEAYVCYGLKCVLAPEIPNNHASLAPFTTYAPPGCILNAQHPAPVATRHVLGHFIPDTVMGAVAQFLPETAPAEGSGALWAIMLSARPEEGGQAAPGETLRRAEMLVFTSGGAGARPGLDGLNATAFPSGVMGMSMEALEQTGPITVWRKELREGSGGAGRQRGGLGQVIEIAANDGHAFWFNGMFDRVNHAARGRAGGQNGAPGRVSLSDGTLLSGKGRQFVPAGKRLVLELPGGGGFGPSDSRDADLIRQDRDRGYDSNA